MYQQPGSFVTTGYGPQPGGYGPQPGSFVGPGFPGFGQPQPCPSGFQQPNPFGQQPYPQQPLPVPQPNPMPQPQLPPMPTPRPGGAPPADGQFVDPEFPPTAASIFNSPNPAADHVQDIVGQIGNNVSWARVTSIPDENGQTPTALFNNIHPNDIMQGILGDCWLLAGFAGLAEFPQLVQGLFQEQQLTANGQYHIRLYDSRQRQWMWVVIDDYIPVGPDGKPAFSKPRETEVWVLLLEKACAKWFGSYVQLAGAFALTPFMFLTDCGTTKAFTQPAVAGHFDPTRFEVKQYHLEDPHNRNSVQAQSLGICGADQAFDELKFADDNNFIAAAWTMKDPPVQAGVGASGEAIAADGIVKGHAYSLVSADYYQADGRTWRIVQVRNPWGSNPTAEWKGELSDNWPMWSQFPELYKKLGIAIAEQDGLFFMPWERFIERFSDWGYAAVRNLPSRFADAERAAAQGTTVSRGITAGPLPKKWSKANGFGTGSKKKKSKKSRKSGNRWCC